jgi:hypothetical protein
MVVRVPGRAPTGANITLHLMPEHMHVFDRASGRRLPNFET